MSGATGKCRDKRRLPATRSASRLGEEPFNPSDRSPFPIQAAGKGIGRMRYLIEQHWDTAVAMALLAGCVALVASG
jgi:hypothetical protein